MKLVKSRLREIIRKVIREAGESNKYTHIGYGKYKLKGKEKDSDAQTFKKTDSGKFEPVGGEKGKEDKPEPKVTKIDVDPFGDDEYAISGTDTDDPAGGRGDAWMHGPTDADSETGKDYTSKFTGTDEPEDTSDAAQHDKQADDIMSITGDDVKFDDYDANDRPLFISMEDPEMEYTVDEKGNIWRHDGFNDKVIGQSGVPKESIIPQLQKEFKQYEFVQKTKNWKHVL